MGVPKILKNDLMESYYYATFVSINKHSLACITTCLLIVILHYVDSKYKNWIPFPYNFFQNLSKYKNEYKKFYFVGKKLQINYSVSKQNQFYLRGSNLQSDVMDPDNLPRIISALAIEVLETKIQNQLQNFQQVGIQSKTDAENFQFSEFPQQASLRQIDTVHAED